MPCLSDLYWIELTRGSGLYSTVNHMVKKTKKQDAGRDRREAEEGGGGGSA